MPALYPTDNGLETWKEGKLSYGTESPGCPWRPLDTTGLGLAPPRASSAVRTGCVAASNGVHSVAPRSLLEEPANYIARAFFFVARVVSLVRSKRLRLTWRSRRCEQKVPTPTTYLFFGNSLLLFFFFF